MTINKCKMADVDEHASLTVPADPGPCRWRMINRARYEEGTFKRHYRKIHMDVPFL